MKTIKSMKKSKFFKTASTIALALFLAIAMSHIGVDNDKNIVIFQPEGFNQAFAVEGAWGGVRGTATIARAANIAINTIVAGLRFVFNNVDNYSGSVGNMYYSFNKSVNTTIGSSSYTGKFEVWNDSLTPGQRKAVEMFFNDVNNPADNGGILFRIRPFAYNQSLYNTGEIFEIRVKKVNDKKTMVIAMSSGNTSTLIQSCEPGTSCRVVRYRIRLIDEGTTYSFAGIAETNRNILNTTCTSQDTASNSYYTLSFLANKTYPNNSTAKFGWVNTGDWSTGNAFMICTGPQTNLLNYGYFNFNGFVQDQVSSDTAGYPTRAEVDAITLDHTDNELDITSSALTHPAFASSADH